GQGVENLAIICSGPARYTVAIYASRVNPYTYLGDCDQACHHCGALFWCEERLKSQAKRGPPHYHRCCLGCRVALPS
nr:hypothetical protein [Tanacetum cinerariifolium]